MMVVAMVSAQGTACPETALRGAEDTPANRAKLERQFCNAADSDAPVAGSWRDVSDNDAFATPITDKALADLTESELDSYVAEYVDYANDKRDIGEEPFAFSQWFGIEQGVRAEFRGDLLAGR